MVLLLCHLTTLLLSLQLLLLLLLLHTSCITSVATCALVASRITLTSCNHQ
jgi:hypothetical protein